MIKYVNEMNMGESLSPWDYEREPADKATPKRKNLSRVGTNSKGMMTRETKRPPDLKEEVSSDCRLELPLRSFSSTRKIVKIRTLQQI